MLEELDKEFFDVVLMTLHGLELVSNVVTDLRFGGIDDLRLGLLSYTTVDRAVVVQFQLELSHVLVF